MLRPALLLASLLLASACGHAGAPATAAQPAAFCAADVHGTGETQAGVEGALHALNLTFLQAHAGARSARCDDLEHTGLVLRYADGALEARLRGRVLRPATSVLPAAYHPLKDVVHALLLAALIAVDPDATHKQAQAEKAGRAIDDVLRELELPESPTAQAFSPEERPRQRLILESARAALRAPDVASARAELERAHEAMEHNIATAAVGTLEGLHAAVQSVRAEVVQLDAKAWNSMLVVVSVAHQARAQALEVQYFERLLREPVTEGAAGERRMVIAENVSEPAQQYGLLAMHLVDELAGRLLFSDPQRLQRDVLSGHNEVLDRLLPEHR